MGDKRKNYGIVVLILFIFFAISFLTNILGPTVGHGAFSGILCSGIIGGAIVPLIVGSLGDFFGLKIGMIFLYVTLMFVFSIGFWAKPLVNNKTLRFKKQTASNRMVSNNA